MPFLPAGVGAAVAAGAASAAAGAAVSYGISQATSSGQKQAITTGQRQATQDVAPYANLGAPAAGALSDFAGLNGPDAAARAMSMYTTSPGYEFARTEGLRAVDDAAAGRGMLRSGATLKAEQAFGTGLASQDFGNYLNRLAGYSGQGLTAGANQAQTATSGATQLSSITGNQGAGTGAALGTATSALGGALTKYLGNSGSVYGSGSGYGTPASNAGIWSGNTLNGYSAPSGGFDAFAGNTLSGYS